MHTITSTWTGLVQQFFSVFTAPGAEIFLRLTVGWVLCTARRSITGILPFADALACLRYELWQDRIISMFGKSAVHDKKFEFLLEALASVA